MNFVEESKILEYEQAPSGYVTFNNYKEPLMKFKDGYGFDGVLLFDGGTDKVQCHLCGEWFHALGKHLNDSHGMTAPEYKEKTGLMKTTALISETFRKKLIASGMDKRLANLRQTGRKKYVVTQETKDKIRASMKEYRMEWRNIRGTCPEQLLDRLLKKYNELGRTPREEEIGFYQSLRMVYGGMKRACELAGIPYRKPGQTVNNPRKRSKEDYVNHMRDFYEKNKRLPRRGEFGRGWDSMIKKYDVKEIQKLALIGDGKYRKSEMKLFLTNSELIQMLRTFKDVNGRIPSYSDCKRGLLPHLSRFSRNFGGWKMALAAAFE